MISVAELPAGLLGALGIKNFGKNPGELAEQYVATIDALEMFLLNRQEFINNTGVAAVAQATVIFPNLACPVGEMWYVWYFDIQTATLGAGVAWRGLPQIRFIATDAVALAPSRSAAAAEQALVPVERGFWLRPGQTLAFLSEVLTGGALNVSAHCLITRIKL